MACTRQLSFDVIYFYHVLDSSHPHASYSGMHTTARIPMQAMIWHAHDNSLGYATARMPSSKSDESNTESDATENNTESDATENNTESDATENNTESDATENNSESDATENNTESDATENNTESDATEIIIVTMRPMTFISQASIPCCELMAQLAGLPKNEQTAS
jgi:S-formylglutathione hydrolase FrmB